MKVKIIFPNVSSKASYSFITTSEVSYAFEKKGEKSCSSGSIIISTSECEIACAQLQLKMGVVRDGKPCYKAGNGKCRQDGRAGKEASLICTSEGNKVCYHLTVISQIKYFNVFVNVLTYTIKFFGQCAIDVRSEPTTPLPTTAAPITTEPGTYIINHIFHSVNNNSCYGYLFIIIKR